MTKQILIKTNLVMDLLSIWILINTITTFLFIIFIEFVNDWFLKNEIFINLSITYILSFALYLINLLKLNKK